MTVEVRRNDTQLRYEILVDDALAGIAEYRIDGDNVVLPHTQVDPAHRGQGLAAILVRHALDDIVARGAKVIPSCPYVKDFITAHPDYHEAVAG